MNEQIQLLKAENVALRHQLAQIGADPRVGFNLALVVEENAGLRILCGDVYTAMLNAGWHEDAIVARIRIAARFPQPPAP